MAMLREKLEGPAAIREVVAALRELTDAVDPMLGTMNFYFGTSARSAVGSETVAKYTRIRDAVVTAKYKLERLDEIRTGA